MQSAWNIFLAVAFPVLTSVIATLLLARGNDKIKNWRWYSRALLLVGLFCVACVLQYLLPSPFPKPEKATNIPVKVSQGTDGQAGPPASTETPNPHSREPYAEDVFVKKNVDNRFRRGNPSMLWAVVIVEDEKAASSDLNQVALAVLQKKGQRATPIFRPSIFEQREFRQLYEADATILDHLKDLCGGVIVGEVKQQHAMDATMQGLITLTATLKIRLLSTRPPRLVDEFGLSTRGGGFSLEVARGQAMERLADELKTRLAEEQF
jgi:hypothetical protein